MVWEEVKALGRLTRIARITVKGGLNLFIGQLFATIVSAIGVIAVMRLLTPSEYGMVTVALIVPTILSLLSGWGMGPALTRHIARFREERQEGGDRGYNPCKLPLPDSHGLPPNNPLLVLGRGLRLPYIP